MTTISVLLCCLVAASETPRADRRRLEAYNVQEVAKLTATDASSNDEFGRFADGWRAYGLHGVRRSLESLRAWQPSGGLVSVQADWRLLGAANQKLGTACMVYVLTSDARLEVCCHVRRSSPPPSRRPPPLLSPPLTPLALFGRCTSRSTPRRGGRRLGPPMRRAEATAAAEARTHRPRSLGSA